MPGAWGSVDASARGRVSTWMCGAWCIDALVHWHIGTLTHLRISTLTRWRVGASAHWRIGASARWCIGMLTRWRIGMWASGWASGQVVLRTTFSICIIARVLFTLCLVLTYLVRPTKLILSYLYLLFARNRTDVYKISFYLISNHRLSLIS